MSDDCQPQLGYAESERDKRSGVHGTGPSCKPHVIQHCADRLSNTLDATLLQLLPREQASDASDASVVPKGCR